MTFELQRESEPAFSGFAQDSLYAHQKKERPRRTLFQKSCAVGVKRVPGLESGATKSHVESPSVVLKPATHATGDQELPNAMRKL
jgi:hypothetical protein